MIDAHSAAKGAMGHVRLYIRTAASMYSAMAATTAHVTNEALVLLSEYALLVL
jgi:hypothetical protein